MAIESSILSRIEFHMSERAKRLSRADDMDAVAAWVEKYVAHAKTHQISLDAQQGMTQCCYIAYTT